MRKRRRRPGISDKPRGQTKHLLIAGAVVLTLGFLFLGFRGLAERSVGPSMPSGRTAAIIDQIALTEPNPDFTEQALSYLIASGFNVDIYEGEDVTVEFFRTLPKQGYDLILFRTHSTNDFVDEVIPDDPVYLYTGQRHNRYSYTYLQLTRQIMAGRVLYEEDAPQLFIVGPQFVRESMEGQFDNTLLVIGGCNSLSTTDMADAFLERGASAVIGWDGLVEMSHNDQALLHLLRELTIEGLSIEQAVTRTRAKVGSDPDFKSIAQYYPLNKGDLTPFHAK